MCTVTYIPDRKGFYLTSNRDEQQRRGAAIPPREFKEEGYTLLYPQDADQHGSWIAAKNTGDVAVLLNGAFKKHTDQPPYRKSRGLVLREIISYEYPYVYFKAMYLEGIAPFTLVLYTYGKLYECRWDGTKRYTVLMDKNTPHIWSSATLYEGEATAKRKQWFNGWDQENPVKTTKRISNFHRTAGNGHNLINWILGFTLLFTGLVQIYKMISGFLKKQGIVCKSIDLPAVLSADHQI